eukprot:CAMPEP_0197288866 /NCGR_PEP_ID=MMETSP0890-20130614/6042_1 /TAXON_ID=44058 ORGANISM="Aureoumbra lagunensis, Strain CCMP1510" /NCGR_SAMPLE_ID=MMETSP0890 /ASSEMBLY_ACC=CAM_ASM_000533 /LENGTH=249 /DNA_ID=CAMNT_0042759885 /DNA_START=159 /DNA_END=908 /DNA_ORIENTATION=-
MAPRASIAVFGATGLTGREVTYQLLAQDVPVRALCRDPSKLVTPLGSCGEDGANKIVENDNLFKFKGDVTKLDDVEKIFETNDVTGVVISLGGKTSDVGKTMLTDGTTNVIQCMKKYDVSRIAVVTSIGTGDSSNQAPFFFKVLMGTVMRSIFEDKNNQEKLFTQGIGSDLDWTIVRPGGLTVEPPTGVINVIDGEAGSIARADVASFCIGAVLDDDWEYVRKTPCISSTGGTAWTKDRSANARQGAMA